LGLLHLLQKSLCLRVALEPLNELILLALIKRSHTPEDL
jgi:hypothetical protein